MTLGHHHQDHIEYITAITTESRAGLDRNAISGRHWGNVVEAERGRVAVVLRDGVLVEEGVGGQVVVVVGLGELVLLGFALVVHVVHGAFLGLEQFDHTVVLAMELHPTAVHFDGFALLVGQVVGLGLLVSGLESHADDVGGHIRSRGAG